MPIKRIVIILVFLSFTFSAFSQRSARWKRMRYEVFYGIGGTNFLGELGGANKQGTNFLADFEYSMTRPLLSLGFRYMLLEKVSTKVMLSYGWLKGDDKTTTEKYRSYRNLNFYTPLVELAVQGEYHITKERVGHRYNLRRVRGVKGIKLNTYFFAGIAGFWFNPKGKDQNGKWQSLQPLGTEGQNVSPVRKKYSRIQVAIPFGIGFKYGVNRKWNIGLELGVRKTFTDYLDDVSTTYYDNAAIEANSGAEAAFLADPSSRTTGQSVGGQQRGDPNDKDTYMFMILNLTYKLRAGRGGLPKF